MTFVLLAASERTTVKFWLKETFDVTHTQRVKES